MTTKEIADFNEVSTKTVRRWVDKLSRGAGQNAISCEKLKMLEAGEKGLTVDWTEEEVYAIMTSGGRGCVVNWMRANKPREQAQTSLSSRLNETDIALISKIVSTTVAETIKQLDGRIEKIEGVVSQRRALLPAPTVKPRDNINRLVRDYATKNKIDFRAAWADLYRDFGYRTNSSPTICAKNRGMAILDYIEAEGMIDLLEAVALDIYGGAA